MRPPSTTMRDRWQAIWVFWSCFALSVLFFVADLCLPLGVAAGIPYMVVILLSVLVQSQRLTLGLSVLAAGLIVVGYFLSPDVGNRSWMVLTNRGLALAALAIVAALSLRTISRELRIRYLSRQLIQNHDSERGRIARGFHDGLGQQLVALKFALDNLRAASGRRNVQDWGLIVQSVDEAIRMARDLSHGINPGYPERLGLAGALRELGRIYGGSDAGRVTMDLAELDGMDLGPASAQIYRIVQEALLNAHRHSGATEVSVSARRESNLFVVTIQDNGRAAVPERGQPCGIGIQIMRERAAMIGADLTIRRGDEGFAVVLTVPAAT